MTTDIINQLINQYTGSISNLQTGSITLGKELFNAIALISIAVLGFNHLLRRNVDLTDANIELIKWLVYLDFFYTFITNFAGIYTFIFSSIQQIGNYLGAQASGNTVNISPANIFSIGINISLKILGSITTLNLFRDILYCLVSVASAAVVLFCFASIGLELILVQIGSQIILAGGIFLLAFSGFQWTRDYAERYVHTFFHLGIKIIFIYILVGLGEGLAQNWSQMMTTVSWQKIIDCEIALSLAAYIYYKLCLKLPDQAVTWLSGRLAMGFDTATDVKGGLRAATGIVKGAMGLDKQMAGMGTAIHAARQAAKTSLETQGKKETGWAVADETIKTLGAAWKQEKDKKLEDTLGGKMAKSIGEAAAKTSDDPTDYSI